MKNKFKGENNIHISAKNWLKSFVVILGILGLMISSLWAIVSFPLVCLFIASVISLGMLMHMTASTFEFHDRQRGKGKTRHIDESLCD